MNDLRFAMRTLRGSPSFTTAAVLLLALGVGGNSAVFGVVDAVLLRSLPYPAAERLAVVRATNVDRDPEPFLVSPPDFRWFRESAGAFEALAAYAPTGLNGTVGGAASERLQAARVSPGFFDVLGVPPAQGRGFLPEEETFGRHRVAVISERLWRGRFGASDDRAPPILHLDGEAYAVVGVMPRGFGFPTPASDVWIPLAFRPGDPLDTRGNYFLNVVGRLAPGVTPDRARDELGDITRRIVQAHPEGGMTGVAVAPLRRAVVGDVASSLLVLLAAMGGVLLIACANLANLLLVRGAARRREIAIRAALGGQRQRIARQMLAEGALLGLAGGIAGVVVTVWGMNAFVAFAPPDLPRLSEVTFRPSLFLFAFAVSAGTIALAVAAPAWRASRVAPMQALRRATGPATGGQRGRRPTAYLVAAQTALSVTLLTGAGLLMRSLTQTLEVDAGYRTEGLLTGSLTLPTAAYPTPDDGWGFFDDLLANLRGVPGVRSAAVTSGLSLRGGNWTKLMTLGDRPLPATLEAVPVVGYRLVSPEYFRAMGIAVREGRSFTEADRTGRGVAVINETLARQYWPDGDPIGKELWMGAPEPLVTDLLPEGYRFPRLEVIGVVASERSLALDRPARPEVYQLYAGSIEWPVTMFVAIAAGGPPSALVNPVRHVVERLDPEIPLAGVATMERLVAESLAPRRFVTGLFGFFAALALALASVGIYGALAQLVAQRRREIGIRIALGADRRRTLGFLLRQGMNPVAAGAVVGLTAALGLTRLMEGLLFNVEPFDARTYVAVAVLLSAVALAACWIPALRAARVDPMEALRHE